MTPIVSTTRPSATRRHAHTTSRTGHDQRRTSHTRPVAQPAPQQGGDRPIPALDAGPITPEQSSLLWAMSKAERIEAMNAGRLSLAQLAEWSARRPDQIPCIGGEFAWLVVHDPVWCEPSRPATGAAE